MLTMAVKKDFQLNEKCKLQFVSQTKVLYGFRRLGIWCIGHTDYFNDAFMVPF